MCWKHAGWLVFSTPLKKSTPSEKIFVNWDDETPNILNIKHVPNHQPAGSFEHFRETSWEIETLATLVGGFNPPDMNFNWDDYSQYMEK